MTMDAFVAQLASAASAEGMRRFLAGRTLM